jgi:hypothetical protein
VLHPLETGRHQCGQLGDGVLVRLVSDRFRCAHTGSTGLSSGAYGGSRNTVSQGRAVMIAAIA